MHLFSKVSLIIDFFTPPRPTIAEMKTLTEEDKLQLASAIARARGYSASMCDFEMVEY